MRAALIAVFASVLSGILLGLALPPADHGWIGWFALAPMLAAVRERGFLIGFGSGLLALFSTSLVARSGLFYFDRWSGGSDAWIYTGCLLFGFPVAILSGIWADRNVARKPLWWFIADSVALESTLLLVLPAHLALTQYRNMPILFLASIGGIWMSTFVVWGTNFGIAIWLRRPTSNGALVWITAIGAIAAANAAWPHMNSQRAAGLAMGFIQTDETDEYSLKQRQQSAVADGADIVVWPEFAGLALAPLGNTRDLQRIALQTGGAIVTSFNDGYKPLPHNAAALVTAETTSQSYFKRRLFGGEMNMHTPGNRAVAAKYRDRSIGLNICFDSCYPSIIRESASLPKVEALALPTIDPESPHYFIAAIHAAFTPFRAAENGIPIVRADGYAYSMAVYSDGSIASQSKGGIEIGSARLDGPHGTLYRLLGDWFLYLCYAMVGIGICKHRGQSSNPSYYSVEGPEDGSTLVEPEVSPQGAP